MQILTNKSKATTIALFLVLTIAVTLVALPATTAQPTKTTYAYIGATPNPIGVGQQVLLHVGITDPLFYVAHGWEGLTVTVTRPDNTTETLGPFKTDSTGGTGTNYIPGQVGTYYLQTNFPEQVMEVGTQWIPDGTVMKASTSEKLALIVTEEPREYYPGSPLPTEYWTRPIDAQLREWSEISGNWLNSGGPLGNYPYRFAPYNDGPESAHILWAKPLATGGLVGGDLGPHAYQCGDAYQGKFSSSVIINGILYYNRYNTGFTFSPPQQGIVAVDLRTGEELWFRNNTRLEFGQTFYWDSFNMHGTLAYLWETVGSTWNAYDPFTAEWVYTMENVPFGTQVYGPNGEIFRYTVNTAQNWMTMWNSTRVVSSTVPGFFVGSWAPEGNTYTDADELGEEWNVTIPAGLPGGINAVFEDRIIGSDVPGWTGLANNPITFWGLDLESGREGQLLFKETWQPPPGNISMLWGTASLEEGVFVITAKDTRALYGFSTDTGKQLWGPTETQHYLDMLTLGEERALPRALVIAYGKLFSVGMGGILYCFNVTTGELEWSYTGTDEYTEILWSDNWPLRITFITDGKIYLVHDEHSPIDPKPRGSPFICLDAETGDEIWKIDGAFRGTEWGGTALIGDSIIALYNSYDQRIYALGKGPSSTTVEAPLVAIPKGTSITIQGMVTDISAGTKDAGLAARFPNGVPAIADEDMSEWMKYVYMQFPIPADPTGVEVSLDTIDPNGNWIHIGTTTSDMSGLFSYMWTPEHEGKYTIIATFMGSEAYYASYAETAIGVGPAPEEPITPAVQEDINQAVDSLTPMFLGLIVAVVVIAILVVYNIWCVRKQRK